MSIDFVVIKKKRSNTDFEIFDLSAVNQKLIYPYRPRLKNKAYAPKKLI
jgi:hypothetical protein